MDFGALITFVVVYFIRPQDWLSFMSGMEIVRPLMIIAAVGIVMRGGNFQPRTLLRTPLDWAMLAYWLWIIYKSPSWWFGISTGASLFGFYYLSMLILNTIRRQLIFLTVWACCLVALAAIGVASEYGVDLTGAHELTHTIFVDRLVINTWLFRNPNAVGHTLIIAIPLLYALLIYRRRLPSWILSLPAIALVAYCVYLTKSKGAFIAGFITLTFLLMFGRGRLFQLMALLLAATLGWGLVTKLPRMQELGSIQTNEAIMGRMLAWENARATMNATGGYGWRQFVAQYEWEGEIKTIATHSSYVRVGAELGKVGLFLFLLIPIICLRQLMSYRFMSTTESRVALMLVTMVVSYMISNWMIDRAYHAEFFLFCGACSAFHRYMLDKWRAVARAENEEKKEEEKDAEDEETEDDDEPYSEESFEQIPAEEYAEPVYGASGAALLAAPAIPVAESLDEDERAEAASQIAEAVDLAKEEELPMPQPKNRLLVIDVVFTSAYLYAVLWFWDYMMKMFFGG